MNQRRLSKNSGLEASVGKSPENTLCKNFVAKNNPYNSILRETRTKTTKKAVAILSILIN
jgi:hypothetical protein